MKFKVSLKLHTQIFIAMVLGVLVGVVFGGFTGVLMPIADIFVRALRMMIVPLVFSSLVMGVVNLGNIRDLGKVGARAFGYYLATTVLAVLLGLLLVNVIHPGLGGNSNLLSHSVQADVIHRGDSFSMVDIFTQIVPENIVESMVKGEMLPLIFFSLLVGSALNLIGKKGAGFKSFVDGLNEVMLRITQWVMLLAPVGVFALMATLVGRTGFAALKPLAFYVIVVLLGLVLHLGGTLSCFLLAVKVSPKRFFQAMVPALATAFTTSSSLATLPVTMDCLERRVGISNKISSFVAPLGATVTMDGTALFEVVAAVFIAQVYGFDLTIMQQVVIGLTATLGSISAAGVPSAGLVTMVIILRAVNLPIEGIGLILAVDRILDMFRTVVNVYGDACGAAFIACLEGEKLDALS